MSIETRLRKLLGRGINHALLRFIWLRIGHTFDAGVILFTLSSNGRESLERIYNQIRL